MISAINHTDVPVQHTATSVDTTGEVEALAINNLLQAVGGLKVSDSMVESEISAGGITHAMLDAGIASLFNLMPNNELANEIEHLTLQSSGSVFGDSLITGISAADINAVVSGAFTVADARALAPNAVGQGVSNTLYAIVGHTVSNAELTSYAGSLSNQMLDSGIASLFDSAMTPASLQNVIVLDSINGGDTVWDSSFMNVSLIGQSATYQPYHG